jgi:hypothetical protein
MRVITAVAALAISTGFLSISAMGGSRMRSLGHPLLSTLTWLAAVAAACAGIFFTSDSLSQEKREGTLGLLFLTDLRGYDVTAGKLFASSLRTFYALLAFVPVLTLTILMGGVTGRDLLQHSLALFNLLFFSLACGLAVSAVGRDSQKVIWSTVVLMLGLLVVGPLVDLILISRGIDFPQRFSWASPAYAFKIAGQARAEFWRSLLISHGIAWLLFGFASWVLPHSWQQRRQSVSGPGTINHYLSFGSARAREALRSRLLPIDPILWLSCRQRWQSLKFWLPVLLLAGLFAAVKMELLPEEAFLIWSVASGLLIYIFYLFTSAEACRFLFEARRSGLLELIFATPINEHLLVKGRLLAMLRLFALPIGLYLLGNTVVGYFGINRSSGMYARAGMGTAGQYITPLCNLLVFAANISALSWFGTWAGLKSRTVGLATLKTLAIVQVLPGMCISFVAALSMYAVMIPIMMGKKSPAFMQYFMLLQALVSTVLTLGKDAFFIHYAHKKLKNNLRADTAGGETFSFTVPPVIAAPPPILPVAGV